MSIPHVGWPVAAGDDEPAGLPGGPAAVGVPARGAAAMPHPGRGHRGSRQQTDGREGQVAGPAVSVLADRLAAALVHHEPGWRLPRHSALARRYNVSAAEIDAAVEELTSRHLVRRLADGQIYRASPAEYVISLEGIPQLTSYVDSMGADLSCRSRHVTRRLPPEDIIWALRLPADQQVSVVRYLWAAGGEAAALSTTYVPADIGIRTEEGSTGLPTVLNLLQPSDVPAQVAGEAGQVAGVVDEARVTDGAPGSAAGGVTGAVTSAVAAAAGGVTGAVAGEAGGVTGAVAGGGPTPVVSATALAIEFQAPPPSVARSLRLTAGQPAMIVTVRFDDLDSGRPVALTIGVLRPDMFRVVLQTPMPPLPAPPSDGDPVSSSGSTAHVAESWDS